MAAKKPAARGGKAPSLDKTIKSVADKLFEAERTGTPIPPVRELLPENDLDAAYRVQDANTERALAAERRLVGRKIGLTAVAVQKQLGVDQPDYGMLFADMCLADGEEVRRGRLIAPRVEAEVAFLLGHDLAHEQPTIADAMHAVEFCVPAIELSRSMTGLTLSFRYNCESKSCS